MSVECIEPRTIKGIDDDIFQSTVTELNTLGKVIKKGLQPDSPELLTRYLQLGEIYTKFKPERMYAIYYLLFNTLFEASSDVSLQTHWRQVCMNHIYRPLLAMQKIAHTKEEKIHVRELRRKLATRRFF